MSTYGDRINLTNLIKEYFKNESNQIVADKRKNKSSKKYFIEHKLRHFARIFMLRDVTHAARIDFFLFVFFVVFFFFTDGLLSCVFIAGPGIAKDQKAEDRRQSQ